MEGVDRSCLRMGLRSLPYIEMESYIVHGVLRQVLVFHSQEVDLINYLVGEDEIGAACVDNCWNQAPQEQRERARICRLLRNTSILARLPTASSIIHHPSSAISFTSPSFYSLAVAQLCVSSSPWPHSAMQAHHCDLSLPQPHSPSPPMAQHHPG
jgi:hypothetical protein